MKTLFVSARSASILLDRGGDYFVPSPVSLFLQADPGSPVLPLGQENRSVFSLFDLQPDTEYTLTARGETGRMIPFPFTRSLKASPSMCAVSAPGVMA